MCRQCQPNRAFHSLSVLTVLPYAMLTVGCVHLFCILTFIIHRVPSPCLPVSLFGTHCMSWVAQLQLLLVLLGLPLLVSHICYWLYHPLSAVTVRRSAPPLVVFVRCVSTPSLAFAQYQLLFLACVAHSTRSARAFVCNLQMPCALSVWLP